MTILHRKSLISALVASVLMALLATGCGAEGDEQIDPGSAADAPDYSAMIEAAPPQLAALYEGEGAGGLIDGDVADVKAQIEALEGTPIVLNKWASWCGPCREEFPALQAQAAERGDEVAFIGINSGDSEEFASTFLRDHPVPYPSYSDPDESIANSFGAVAQPVTIIIDEAGEVAHTKTGPYLDEGELAADIERYTLAG